jgi:hypothetical protein
MSRTRKLLCILCLSFAGISILDDALAHPEDEFCVPGQGSLDPALCEALSELDRPDAGDGQPGPVLDDSGEERSVYATAVLYVSIGMRHILPDGLDHILFVLALFLSSTRVRALVIQISTFTVAHTVTLGLAAAGVISPQAGIVEPLIAATIAFVAIENVFLPDMPSWRPLFVFTFGLIHGLGFAGFFGELGLPAGQFWSALVSFNIGVEIGQLTVIGLALLLAYGLRRWFAATNRVTAYRRWIVVPVSLCIAMVGMWWAVERMLAQLA